MTLDEANKSKYRGFKLFVEDAGASVGVTDDQTLLGYTYLSLSDYLGDRRLVINFSSVSSFSNFDVVYFDLSPPLDMVGAGVRPARLLRSRRRLGLAARS